MMDTFFGEETINYAIVQESVSQLLEAMAAQLHQQLNSSENSIQYKVSEFDSHTVPDIQLSDYLHRIASLSKCTNRDFISALVYIDRLINNEVISGISFFNVHRLIAVSIMISTKFYMDKPRLNKRWAKIIGISLRELNSIEINFLMSINYNLRIELSVLSAWYDLIFRFSSQASSQNSNTAANSNCDQNSSELNEIADEGTHQAKLSVDL